MKPARMKVELVRLSTADTDDCVPWPHAVRGGYGAICHNNRGRYAHRIAYMLAHGEIPTGMHVMHLCNNKLCVNLRHLKVGTPSENTRAAYADGLIDHAKGSRLPQTKLSEVHVRVIRTSLRGTNELARMLGVSPATITLIRQRKNWKHVP